MEVNPERAARRIERNCYVCSVAEGWEEGYVQVADVFLLKAF